MVFRIVSVMAVGISTVAASTITNGLIARSLLDADNRTISSPGVRASIEAEPEMYSLCGVDIVEGDQWTARYPNPDSCVANCLPQTGCNAATWTRTNGGTCYFKRLVGGKGWVPNRFANMEVNVGAVSFIRREDISPYWQPNTVAQYDMPGNDLTSIHDSTGESCYSACLAVDRCSAYTWSGYNGGTCWLKTKASPYVISPNTATRIVARPGSPGYCMAVL
jgi:hypothetical protein